MPFYLTRQPHSTLSPLFDFLGSPSSLCKVLNILRFNSKTPLVHYFHSITHLLFLFFFFLSICTNTSLTTIYDPVLTFILPLQVTKGHITCHKLCTSHKYSLFSLNFLCNFPIQVMWWKGHVTNHMTTIYRLISQQLRHYIKGQVLLYCDICHFCILYSNHHHLNTFFCTKKLWGIPV